MTRMSWSSSYGKSSESAFPGANEHSARNKGLRGGTYGPASRVRRPADFEARKAELEAAAQATAVKKRKRRY